MKKFRRIFCILAVLLLFLSGCRYAATSVSIVSPAEALYVTDDADILSDQTEKEIVEKVKLLKDLCGGEIAVVTIRYLTSGLDSEEYAREIINRWGVGDSEKNNGVVLLLVPGEGKGWVTAGVGIERALTAGKLE